MGVVIPAAGRGVRLGGVPKPFLDLCGEPILLRTLRPFLEHPQVEVIVVALGEEEYLRPPGWLKALKGRVILVQGGAHRGESVWSAIQALPPEPELVAIHDAARPLVSRAVIDRCIEAVTPSRGAVAGWPVADTLKGVDEGERVVSTLPREGIWYAQTPQIFPRGMIVEAYRKAIQRGVVDTDDSALVERIGLEVVMVRGSVSNLKVTRPEDLALAELLFREEEE